jgi:hypothetical protein
MEIILKTSQVLKTCEVSTILITMKTFIIFSLLVLLSIPAFAVEKTLISGKVESGGFGGPVLKFTNIKNDFALLVGGRGGWIVNHTFVVGGGGYGLTTNVKVKRISPDTTLYLDFGYGGFEMEYIYNSNEVVHFTISTLMGAGGVNYSTHKYYDYSDNYRYKEPYYEGDAFFVLDPTINLELNVAKFFRMDFGFAYRTVYGINMVDIKDSDLSGFAGVLTFKFGKF